MDQLLEQIFKDLFLLSEHPLTEEYRQQLDTVSALQDQVTAILGQEFSEQLWYAHSQLTELELKDAFLFGLRLFHSLDHF